MPNKKKRDTIGPSVPKLQGLMGNMLEPKLAASHESDPREYPIEKDYHPIGASQGIMERMIKNIPGRKNFYPQDNIYLEQYLHPEYDIIPKQSLRPTNVKDMPDMEFRHVPDRIVAPDSEGNPIRWPNVEGLGLSNRTQNDEYKSIYDTWDFDTDADLFPGGLWPINRVVNWGAKKFMQHAGTPFAVYERYPKDFESPNVTFEGDPEPETLKPKAKKPLPAPPPLLVNSLKMKKVE